MHLDGSCHCGALTVRIETARAIADLPVRMCGCSFCVKHRPRYTADPQGHAQIRIANADAASRYRFGLRLADFLVCRTCGVFVCAFGDGRAVINLETLIRASDFTAAPVVFAAYDTEDASTRSARRAKNWMPATLEIG